MFRIWKKFGVRNISSLASPTEVSIKGFVALAAGLAVSAIGAGIGLVQEARAAKEAERAAEFENARAEVENRQRRIQQIRQGRIQRAQVVQAGETQGVAGSTGVMGGAASIQSQLATNVAAFGQQQAAGEGAARSVSRARRATERAGVAQAVGGAGQDVFQSQGGYQQLFTNLGVG